RFDAGFVQLGRDQFFPGRRGVRPLARALLVVPDLGGEADPTGAFATVPRAEDAAPAAAGADAEADEPDADQQREAHVDHPDRVATAASSEIEQHQLVRSRSTWSMICCTLGSALCPRSEE